MKSSSISRRKYLIVKKFCQINSDWFLMKKTWRTSAHCTIIIYKKNRLCICCWDYEKQKIRSLQNSLTHLLSFHNDIEKKMQKRMISMKICTSWIRDRIFICWDNWNTMLCKDLNIRDRKNHTLRLTHSNIIENWKVLKKLLTSREKYQYDSRNKSLK